MIVGFALQDEPDKWLFDYETTKSEPHTIKAWQINPYLVDAVNLVLENRRSSICQVPPIVFGSMLNDGGHLLLSAEEKQALLNREPKAEKWLRRLIGSDEFINNGECWCLWLAGIGLDELLAMPAVLERVEAVQRYRLASSHATTRELSSNTNAIW